MKATPRKTAALPSEEKRAELLFEIGCEEIPPRMLPNPEEELKANL